VCTLGIPTLGRPKEKDQEFDGEKKKEEYKTDNEGNASFSFPLPLNCKPQGYKWSLTYAFSDL
jgi:hypothetical protein